MCAQQALEACELQCAEAPELLDPASEDREELLTNCRRLLRVHAAAALGKGDKELLASEADRFAYVVGGKAMTLASIDAMLGSLSNDTKR